MLIEPREAEPGALWRWTRQASSLIGRAFGFWIGLVLLMCLWMFFGQRLPIVDGILALAAFFASILIAAEVDRPQRATLGDVLAMLRRHAVQMLVFSAIIAVAGAVIWMLLLSRPAQLPRADGGVAPWEGVSWPGRRGQAALPTLCVPAPAPRTRRHGGGRKAERDGIEMTRPRL
jgi:hypothetical protein